MAKKVSDYYIHDHPLIFIENVSDMEPTDCYGCGEVVTNLEAAYVCEESCSSRVILHKKCGELPDEICHPKHSQHPLYLGDGHESTRLWCRICLRDLYLLGYNCFSCEFVIDLNCAKLVVMEKQLTHPSHPDHALTLMRKPAFKFCCDGCGDEKVDMAYICSSCEFWIHKTCASLPVVLQTNRHHHPVSLLFSFPEKLHLKYGIYDCDVCLKRLNMTWVYSCGDCSFYAHLRCVTSSSETTERVEEDDNDGGSDLIEFPLHPRDISEKLITPFVRRENKIILDLENMPKTSAAYSFLSNYHKHPLTLISEFSHDAKQFMDEEEDEDEGSNATDDELKICNVCVTPISSPPYYECNACKYFVHSICSFLPKTISSPSSLDFYRLYGRCPVTQNENHKFTLRTRTEYEELKNKIYICTYCFSYTNGIVYECEGCKKKMDVKCASLSPAIRHASHRHHKPLTITRIPQGSGKDMFTRCCLDFTDTAYCCTNEDCNFALDWKCLMLPASVMMLEWEKHPLQLTFYASFDHPSSFICDFCEEDMHPKAWMYHCRQCDNSFHRRCLSDASGWYKNVKFGGQFILDGLHPHPLTFNYITIKKRCDICRAYWYGHYGLECALCIYVMCINCVLISQFFT